MTAYANRLLRAAKLDVSLYEEVESEPGLMGQAMGTVILSSVAAGIGVVARGGLMGILWGSLFALLGWYIWAYLTYLIGTQLLPEEQTSSSPSELLRTIGFSSSPGIVRILGIFPALTGIVFLAASLWMLVAMVVAVRQALDYTSTLRAVGVCVIAWLIQALIIGLVFWITGGQLTPRI